MSQPVPMIDSLGIYLLPGEKADASPFSQHAAEAEALGFGTLWISEKFSQKDASVLLGVASQAARRAQLGTAVIHPHTRHPLVLAGFGSTMQVVSGGRFTMGVGRSSSGTWQGTGLRPPTTDMLRDTAEILRRLWSGQTISYDGPAGHFTALRIRHAYDGPAPRLMISAVGPRTLTMGGEVYDGVITRPFLGAEALARSVEHVRAGARAAGREPAEVRIVHVLVVGCGLPRDQEAAILGGRLVRYLHRPGGSAEMLPDLNGWDQSVVREIRAHPFVVAALESGRRDFTLDELAQVADDVVPEQWIRESAAVGTPAECAGRIRDYLAAGADEVILHGNVPTDLRHVVAAFRSEASAPAISQV